MTNYQPFFSVIIPTYARPERLAACLQAIVRLNYPLERFEVIVVDDGSPISLEPVVTSFSSRLTVTVIRQNNSGPATACNTGSVHANGAYLAFTDDDCAPAPDWLQALAEQFAVTPDHLIGGQTLNALPKNLFSIASQQLVSYLYVYYNSDSNKARFLTSNNLAVSAEGFRAAGGFDTTFSHAAGEDRELCDRWLFHGNKITYVPKAIVYHTHTLFLRSFLRQHFNYGRGDFYYHQTRLHRNQKRIRMEPLSFYLNLFCYPLSQSRNKRALFLMLLFLCSQVVCIMGYFWEKIDQPK